MNKNIILIRSLLLVFGCIPTVALYVTLSFGVALFPLSALFMGGSPMNVIFVALWLLFTYGTVALVYSCVTYRRNHNGVKMWQKVGLIAEVVLLAIVVLMDSTFGLGIMAALMGLATALILVLTDDGYGEYDPEKQVGST